LGKRSWLLEINFQKKLPTQKAEVKILQPNSFTGDKKLHFLLGELLVYIWSHVLPNNIPLNVYVNLRSLEQRLEQSVITAFVPTPRGAKNVSKKIFLQDIPNSPLTTSVCQRKPANPHIPVRSMTQFCCDYVMSRFAYELWHM